MANNASHATPSLNLEIIRSDPRLNRVTSADVQKPVTLQLWILQTGQQTKFKLDLLYAQVIPSRSPNINSWRAGDSIALLRDINKTTEVFRILPLYINQTGERILAFVKEFIRGKTLKEASLAASLSEPDTKFAELRLASSPTNVNQIFAVRPSVFLTTRLLSNHDFNGCASPISDAPAYVASLFRLDKSTFWNNANGERYIHSSELIRDVLATMQRETHFDFQDTDSKRLGNIEWISFPAFDENENALIQYDPVKVSDTEGREQLFSAQAASVLIHEGTFHSGTELVVRCRLLNGDEIVSDQCQSLIFTGKKTELSFQANETISNIMINVWARVSNDNPFALVYEHGAHLVRQISVSVNSIDTYTTKRSLWLDKLLGEQIVPKITLKKSLLIPQEYRNDPWVPVGREITASTKKLFPQKSGGAFFQKGNQPEADRIDELAGWINSIMNNHFDIETAILFDPYFGNIGVDLIASIRRKGIEFIAVTTSTLPSEDDMPSRKRTNTNRILREITWLWDCVKESLKRIAGRMPSEPIRAKQIKDYCINRIDSLKYLSFRILDFRTSKGGQKQLFHDRYFLLFDHSGVMIEGYHLSNSLQKAMVNFPLLITPIPGDLCEPFKQYIETIFSKVGVAGSSTWEVQTIFSTHDLRDQTQRAITLIMPTSPAIDLQLVSSSSIFLQALENASTPVFGDLMKGLAVWSFETAESDAFLEDIVRAASPNLGDKVFSWLSSLVNQISLAKDIAQEEYFNALAKWLNADFVSALKFSRDAWLHGFIFETQGIEVYTLKIGLRFLAKLAPQKFGELSTVLYETAKKNQSAQVYLLLIIDESYRSLEFRKDINLRATLLTSTVPILRALASRSSANNPVETGFLKVMEPMERIFALSSWVYELRVQANIKGKTESAEIKAARLDIFNAIIDAWRSDAIATQLRQIVSILSGPIEGSWAYSIQEDLFDTLINRGAISLSTVADLWLCLFRERLKTGSNRLHFYAPVDIELTEVAASILARLPDAERCIWLDKFRTMEKSAARIIDKALARHWDYAKWIDAVGTIIWLNAFGRLVVKFNNSVSNSVFGDRFIPILLDPKGAEHVAAIADLIDFQQKI